MAKFMLGFVHSSFGGFLLGHKMSYQCAVFFLIFLENSLAWRDEEEYFTIMDY